MTIACPATKDAASEHSQRIAAATSSGRADASDGVVGANSGFDLRITANHGVLHGCDKTARTNRIDANAGLGILETRRLRQPQR